MKPSDSKFYVAKVTYISPLSDKEMTDYNLYAGDSYAEALNKVISDYSECDVAAISLASIFTEGESLSLSKSLAEAFMYDLTDEVECIPTEWRKNMQNKGIQTPYF